MKELTYKANIDNIVNATEDVATWLDELGCPPVIQTKTSIALDEVLSNIVRYAYPNKDGSFTVRLFFDDHKKVAGITFIDQGVAFNPLMRAEPDTTLASEKRPIGGLGIFLVKKLMDHVEYKREDGRNYLTLYKKIL